MKKLPKKVLILGSGALKIGQAGEFDYSGSQAIKALKEEGIKTILVNPNIATIQTTTGFADSLYFLPVNPFFVAKVIAQERPDGLLLGFGGQTALNCGLELAKKNILNKYNVQVLGTPITAIEATESREIFAQNLKTIGLKIPKSNVVHNLKTAQAIAGQLGFPVICRNGFSLGGQGSSIAKTAGELQEIIERSLTFANEILIEECLTGWKELEYEVVRDAADNCIIVCNMENMDPMGVHTGESIVVAPSQTLSNEEYFRLRAIAQQVIRHFGIVGECNIQFALNPKNSDYRIIEVNARLSRSSALASKVTGYPLAAIAAKLALGYRLDELTNSITQKTSALFEPALDYLAVKIPRWDFAKFGKSYQKIGTEMQSVGEVMAIGRSFPETIQKAVRMLNQGQEGVVDENTQAKLPAIKKMITTPNSKRLFQIVAGLIAGLSPQKIAGLTRIDPWFISELKKITDFYCSHQKKLTKEQLQLAKQLGFSDKQLGQIFGRKQEQIRALRKKYHILPVVKQIDTLAAEYPAQTNYLYLTYHGTKDDLTFGLAKQVLVLASGPYSIGSSVEFDWCAVNTVKALRAEGLKTILVNSNPETVSTDYDITDKLYFDELTLERILDITDKEKVTGAILSMGGQIPNNLALPLAKAGIPIMGTKAADIDLAEDREKFSRLLNQLGLAQPQWQKLETAKEALAFAQKIGYPIIVRPSYVLSGQAMFVAYSEASLKKSLAKINCQSASIVISKFIDNAKEIEADLVAQGGKIILCAISEHIENAGVHSGDASIVFPAQKIYLETVRKIKAACAEIAQALTITGPANIQFLAKDNQLLIIECNLRASRTFPFISKMCRVNFIETAVKTILGQNLPTKGFLLDAPFVGVKVPQFSFSRLKEVDPILRVEMASTGEVACLGDSIGEAYLKSLIATDIHWPRKTVLISLGGEANKIRFLPEAKMLFEMGLTIYATQKTSAFFQKNGIKARRLYKIHEKLEPNIKTYLIKKKLDLVINLTDQDYLPKSRLEDDYFIRRTTVDCCMPLITNLQAAKLFVQSLAQNTITDLKIKSYTDYKLSNS